MPMPALNEWASWKRVILYLVGGLSWLPGLALFMDWPPLWSFPIRLVLMVGLAWSLAGFLAGIATIAQPARRALDFVLGGLFILSAAFAGLLLWAGCLVAGLGGEPCL